MTDERSNAAPSDPLREQLQASIGDACVIERELEREVSGTRVFVARDGNADAYSRETIIKVLSYHGGAALDAPRFRREIAFAASRLEDRTVIPPIAGGAVDGAPYVTMPYVAGETLAARLARDRTLSIDESVRILRDVARALAHGHSFGILHRALRPSCVLLSRDVARVSDFGVQRALDIATGVAPNPHVDNRSDIHDFGVLGYELLTGDAPLGDAPTLIQNRRTEVPQNVATLVMRCMAASPNDRPQTAGEIASALDEIISPSDFGILGQLGIVNSSTVEARSEYYRSRGALGLVVIALFAVVAGYFTWRSTRALDGSASPPPAASIAVLPFTLAGSDSASAYLADALTDELAAALRAVKPGALTVVSRGATGAALSTVGSDSKKLGERLQVSALLSAQVQQTGAQTQLAAELTDASNGKRIWSKSYASADPTVLEDSVARAVTSAMHVTIAAGQPIIKRETSVASARDAYLRGRFVMRAREDEGSLRRATDLFGQAVRDDPRYVAAWSELAAAWAALSDDYVAPKEAVPHIRDAVAHGLAIDSSDAPLRFTHGLIAYLFDRDARAAQTLMSAALVANPNLANATRWYPQVLWTNGLRDSATAYLRRAVARDSTSPETLTDAWRFARESGDALRAIEYCGKLKQLRAGAWCDATQQLDIAQSDGAIALAQAAANAPGARDMEARLQLIAVLVAAERIDAKHRAEAAKILADVDRAAASTSHTYLRGDDIALMHSLVGDSTGAMQWFDRALAEGSAGVGAFYWRTVRNPVRMDSRAKAFAAKAGLPAPPAYWP